MGEYQFCVTEFGEPYPSTFHMLKNHTCIKTTSEKIVHFEIFEAATSNFYTNHLSSLKLASLPVVISYVHTLN